MKSDRRVKMTLEMFSKATEKICLTLDLGCSNAVPLQKGDAETQTQLKINSSEQGWN